MTLHEPYVVTGIETLVIVTMSLLLSVGLYLLFKYFDRNK